MAEFGENAPPCARPGARQACACSRRGPSPGRRPVPSPSWVSERRQKGRFQAGRAQNRAPLLKRSRPSRQQPLLGAWRPPGARPPRRSCRSCPRRTTTCATACPRSRLTRCRHTRWRPSSATCVCVANAAQHAPYSAAKGCLYLLGLRKGGVARSQHLTPRAPTRSAARRRRRCRRPRRCRRSCTAAPSQRTWPSSDRSWAGARSLLCCCTRVTRPRLTRKPRAGCSVCPAAASPPRAWAWRSSLVRFCREARLSCRLRVLVSNPQNLLNRRAG